MKDVKKPIIQEKHCLHVTTFLTCERKEKKEKVLIQRLRQVKPCKASKYHLNLFSESTKTIYRERFNKNLIDLIEIPPLTITS